MSEKQNLDGLFVDNPETPEGKYLVLRRDGTAVEWPHFVLGAKDPMAFRALYEYADAAEDILRENPERAERLGITPAFIAAVRRRGDFFIRYCQEHGEGDPGKGRHRKDDPVTVARMREAQGS